MGYPDDVHSATSLQLFRKKLKTYLFEKAYPPQFLLFIRSFSLALTPAISQVNAYRSLLFLYEALRVYLHIEIKRYIRIRIFMVL